MILLASIPRCVPNLDVQDDDENRLHYTAVAGCGSSLRFRPSCCAIAADHTDWHDKADALDTWAVEYEDILRSIPETNRKTRRVTPFKAHRWRGGFVRSPIDQHWSQDLLHTREQRAKTSEPIQFHATIHL